MGTAAPACCFGDGAGAVGARRTRRLPRPRAFLDFSPRASTAQAGSFFHAGAAARSTPPTHETVDQKMDTASDQVGPQVSGTCGPTDGGSGLPALLESNGLLDSRRKRSEKSRISEPGESFARWQERAGRADDSKILINIDRYANTTAGTIPLGIRDAVEQKLNAVKAISCCSFSRWARLYHWRQADALGVLGIPHAKDLVSKGAQPEGSSN